MGKLSKALLFLSMGLLTSSCGNAQGEAEKRTKEYNAKEIIKKINKGEKVVIANAIIKDDLLFSNIDDMDFTSSGQFSANINSPIFFQSCVFLGDVKAEGNKVVEKRSIPVKSHFSREVNFMDCDFRKDVDFSEAEFERGLNFCKSTFRGATEFNNMLCNGKQNQWWEITADSTFFMCGTIFRGDVNMMDATFKQGCTLQKFTVNNLQISNMECEGDYDFSNATINGEMLFNYATITGDATLSFGRYTSRLDILGSSFKGKCDLERSLFYGKAKFNKSLFEGEFNTKDAQFLMAPDYEESKFEGESNQPTFQSFK